MRFSIACFALGSTLCSIACGGAPDIAFDESANAGDTVAPASSQQTDANRAQPESVQATQALIAAPESESDPPLDTDTPAEEEACAPSVVAQTENVPELVERTIDKTVEVPTEVELLPTVLVLMDRSKSMTLPLDDSGQSRWQAVQAALFEGDTPILKGLSHEVALGLTHFSGVSGTTGENGSGHCVELSVPVDQIDFERDNFDALWAQQSNTTTRLFTPTGEAMTLAAQSFENVESDGQKHMIVVTDGEPAQCNDLWNQGSEQGMAYAVDAARVAHEHGIVVHVIGIGPEVSEDHLRQMAEAGGGLYRSALDGTAVEQAFADVLHEVQTVVVTETTTEVVTETVTEEQKSCQFDIDFGKLGREAFEQSGSVNLGSTEVALDTAEGWFINDDGMLELAGAACALYQGEDDVALHVELACPNRAPGVVR